MNGLESPPSEEVAAPSESQEPSQKPDLGSDPTRSTERAKGQQAPQEGYIPRHEPNANEILAMSPEPYTEGHPQAFDANKGLLEAAKEFLFIADDAGEPRCGSPERGIVTFLWDDGSLVTVRFEARRGELGAVQYRPAGDVNLEAANKSFSERKKQRDETRGRQKQEAEKTKGTEQKEEQK